MTLEQVNFLIELMNTQGLSVPIALARVAYETQAKLLAMRDELSNHGI